MLSGRPLLDTRPDAALFVNRTEELAALQSALALGLNALAVGGRGSGKTSLLRAFLHRARRGELRSDAVGPLRSVYVRGEGAGDAADLLGRVERSLLGGALGEDGAGRGRSEPGATARGGRDVGSVLADLAGSGSASHEGLLVVLDDVPAGAGHDLFGVLRDELWAVGLLWVVACPDTERAELLRPPADAFFERVVDLQPLTEAAARDLLRRRMGGETPPEEVLAELVRAAGGNPRRLLDLAREVAAGRLAGGAELAAATTARARALGALGRPEAMVVAEIEALGPVSASDPRLLDRLGWTRPRAAQVLAELERAGLVASETVRSGAGRPRRVFRLRPTADFAPAPHQSPAPAEES